MMTSIKTFKCKLVLDISLLTLIQLKVMWPWLGFFNLGIKSSSSFFFQFQYWNLRAIFFIFSPFFYLPLFNTTQFTSRMYLISRSWCSLTILSSVLSLGCSNCCYFWLWSPRGLKNAQRAWGYTENSIPNSLACNGWFL